MKFIEKRRQSNGRREIYILGHKLFTYWCDKLKKVKRNCGIPLPFAKKLIREKNTWFPHPFGIVISDQSEIGHHCSIFQNVTLGAKVKKGVAYYPSLGDNVTVFCNSVVLGGVHIGDNSIIGAGSVVLSNVPKNEIWAGNPARFIKKREEYDE